MVPPWNPSSATGVPHPNPTSRGHPGRARPPRRTAPSCPPGRSRWPWRKSLRKGLGGADGWLMDDWWMAGGWLMDGWWLGCGCLLEPTKWKARSGNGKVRVRGKPRGWWGGKNQVSVAKIKVWRANDTKNMNYGTSMNKLHIYIYIYICICT